MAWTAEQIKEAGLDDFRRFLAEMWSVLALPKPTRIQNDIALYLQHGPPRRMIQAFRGVGKSFITTAYVVWQLMQNPQLKIMVVSANQELANDISKFCKDMIGLSPIVMFLTPDRLAGQRTSNISFDVGPTKADKSPSVKSVGITGQLTGSRADIIIADDVEVPKNSQTHTMRERLALLTKEFASVLKPDGEIIYLGTPQVEQTLYNRLPERGYEIRVWPAEVPTSVARWGGSLAPKIAKMVANGVPEGTPTDPQRFNREVLDIKKAEVGLGEYCLQFMLDTTPANLEKHPLKLGDLIVMDVDREVAPVKVVWGSSKNLVLEDLLPGGFDGDVYHRPAWVAEEMVEFQAADPKLRRKGEEVQKDLDLKEQFGGTVMFIDPSGTGKDETAYAVVRFLYSQLFLVGVGGFKHGFSEATLRGLAQAAAKFKVDTITMERNYGGGMFGQLLRPAIQKVSHARVLPPEEMPWSSGQKEIRILNTMEPLVQNHQLIVDRRCIEEDWKQQVEDNQYSWVFQYTRISRDKGALGHEDRLEAIQGACQYWVDRMNRDRDQAILDVKDERLDAELANYMKSTLGFKRNQPTMLRRPV
jgi:hypothetical protein